MDEVESMWMEVVVFRIDLMNNWIDRGGSDRYEVDDMIILAHEASEFGLQKYGGLIT